MTNALSWKDLNLGSLLREALRDRVVVLVPGEEGVEVHVLERGHLAALQVLANEAMKNEVQSKEEKKP